MKLSECLAVILVLCVSSNVPAQDLDGGTITSGQTLSGTLDAPADRDFYQFEGSRGDRIKIVVKWTSRSSSHPQVALYPLGGGDREATGTEYLEHAVE